ncbi:4789_t:CDS:2, partial [Funneliformis mosseae]
TLLYRFDTPTYGFPTSSKKYFAELLQYSEKLIIHDARKRLKQKKCFAVLSYIRKSDNSVIFEIR